MDTYKDDPLIIRSVMVFDVIVQYASKISKNIKTDFDKSFKITKEQVTKIDALILTLVFYEALEFFKAHIKNKATAEQFVQHLYQEFKNSCGLDAKKFESTANDLIKEPMRIGEAVSELLGIEGAITPMNIFITYTGFIYKSGFYKVLQKTWEIKLDHSPSTKAVSDTQKYNQDINFWIWLKGINTLKISKNSTRALKLGPRWLWIMLITLGNINNIASNKVIFWIIIDFCVSFLVVSLVWYGFDRLRGKTKIS